MIISAKFTHADLLAAPDDGKRREIIDGEMFVTPSPNVSHQAIVLRIAFALQKYLEENPIGKVLISPLDVIFSEYDVLEPDLLFLLNEHRDILKDWVRGAPDLVVEILSPTTAIRDRGIKLRAYSRFGVKEYWIVDPDQKAIEVYRLAPDSCELVRSFAQDETLTSALLPGFVLPVHSIFQF